MRALRTSVCSNFCGGICSGWVRERVVIEETNEEATRVGGQFQLQIRTIDVPLALLLSRALTPAAKLLWIRLRFDATHRRQRSHVPERLAKRTCLARSTVYEALKRAAASGWLVPHRDRSSGKRRWRTLFPALDDRTIVKIPVDLIRASHAVRPQALLCYGLLQATSTFNGLAGEFKWAEFSKLTGLHLKTVKRAVRALAKARWIATAQKNRLAPIWFRLQHADQAYKEEMQKGLEESKYGGEGLMRALLSLNVDTRECVDGARPYFLENPSTKERMELDRFYPVNRVAFEFNGPQHYVATGRFSKQEVAAQRKRDALKRQICKEKEIALVVIQAEDLSLTTMRRKVGDKLPLRALRGFKQTIQYLNTCSQSYRKAARSG